MTIKQGNLDELTIVKALDWLFCIAMILCMIIPMFFYSSLVLLLLSRWYLPGVLVLTYNNCLGIMFIGALFKVGLKHSFDFDNDKSPSAQIAGKFAGTVAALSLSLLIAYLVQLVIT